MGYVKVAKTNEIKEGECRTVECNGGQIAVFNINGEFFAIDNICPHKGGPLGDGTLDDDVVTCPWHGWKFSVKTGVSPVFPTAKVRKYAVKVDGEDIFVDVP